LAYSKNCPDICVERLGKKTTKNLMLAGVPAEIGSAYLLNTIHQKAICGEEKTN
jgi:hypothetical protein